MAGGLTDTVAIAAMEWDCPASQPVTKPAVALALLRRAATLDPANPSVRADLGNVLLDLSNAAEAAAAFEAAVRLAPSRTDLRFRLALCWNRLGRHEDVLALLDEPAVVDSADSHYLRGLAETGLGRTEVAQQEFRASLGCDAGHREAWFELGRLLQQNGEFEELGTWCADLWVRGARHVQLLLDWGRALDRAGRRAEAQDMVFAPAKITRTTIAVPDGFATLDAFNAALAEELTSNPHPITDVAAEGLAMRGGARIRHLMNGRRPDLIRSLLDAIRQRVDEDVAQRTDLAHGSGRDRWLECRPRRASLSAWGVIQDAGAYEAWHAHRSGWMSGVYYVAVPDGFSTEGGGAGCIEFGDSPSVAGHAGETLRIAPHNGLLLLMPSHFHHRTIPFASDRKRISIAFDIRPV